jgi:hypothetical protein
MRATVDPRERLSDLAQRMAGRRCNLPSPSTVFIGPKQNSYAAGGRGVQPTGTATSAATRTALSISAYKSTACPGVAIDMTRA